MSPLPLQLLPDNAEVGDDDRLRIGGVDLEELADRFGTPLFVYDEDHLRARCREAVSAFGAGVAYASKAFLCKEMARLAHGEGMHIDIASGGELFVCLAAGLPPSSLVLHGNNKSADELAYALDEGVGTIVLDSFDELDRIETLVADGKSRPRVLLRVTPGVEAHTHSYVQTGQADSKFGFGIPSGDAARAVEAARASDAVDFAGIHMHIGSQIFTAVSFAKALDVLAPFVASVEPEELCIGGGLGVAYVEGEESESITAWGERVSAACQEAGITARITAEPGRSIAAAAGITLYRVGTIKEIPEIRTYVAVDGGMIDNPRPALYGSGYETFLPSAVGAERDRTVTVVGKHCESGDVLVRDAKVPAQLEVGDILATPVTGAYGHGMGSNYNKLPRPAVVFVSNGEVREVVRRETYADLTRHDL